MDGWELRAEACRRIRHFLSWTEGTASLPRSSSYWEMRGSRLNFGTPDVAAQSLIAHAETSPLGEPAAGVGILRE